MLKQTARSKAKREQLFEAEGLRNLDFLLSAISLRLKRACELIRCVRRAMANTCTSAYYGKQKKLRDDTWEGIAADIGRRLACGELSDNVRRLGYAGDCASPAQFLHVAGTPALRHQMRTG